MIIYKTTNLINGKIYVGQDSNNNPEYLGSGLLLEKAFLKYGMNNFKKEILEKCLSKEELDLREIFWIEKLNSIDKKIGYNIAKGGAGGDTISGKSDNEIFRKFLSERNKKFYKDKSNHPMFGKKQTAESNEKRRNSILGTKRSNSTKRKMSNSVMGSKNQAFGKIWIHNRSLDKNKFIKKEQLDEYIINGWELGMKKKKL
jgi:group I intron endonuclease